MRLVYWKWLRSAALAASISFAGMTGGAGAARLVGLGNAGSVTLTFDQWQEVQHLCRARAIGKLDVKGKGPVEIVECYAVA